MSFYTPIIGIALLLWSGFWSVASAQPDTLWTRIYDFGDSTGLYATAELSSGGFAATGYSVGSASDDAFIMRLDPMGDTTWTRSYGAPTTGDRSFDVTELTNGNLVTCGVGQSGLASFVACFSQTGQQLWWHDYDPPGASQAAAVLALPDGGFWLLARKTVTGRDLDFWLIRCNADGDSLFSRTFGTTSVDVPEDILFGLDGNLELIGSTRNPADGRYDFIVITVSSTGDHIRQEIYGGGEWEQTYCATRDTVSGDLLIGGEIRSGADRDAYAMRLDAFGQQLWSESYSENGLSERIAGAAPYLEGGALFAGQTGGSILSGQLWLISVGINGDTSWTWHGTETARAFEDLVRIEDGGFVACGRATVGGYERPLMWRISPPSGISGVVRDRITNETIQGVRVQAASLPQYSVTDTIGRFTLALPPGNYTIYTGGPCFSGDTLHNIEVVANENTLTDITVGVAHLSTRHSTINVLGQNRGQGSADFIISNAGSGDLVYSFEPVANYPTGNWLDVEPASGRLAPGDTLDAHVIVSADTSDSGNYDYFGQINLHSNSCPETLIVVQVLAVILDANGEPALPSEFALYPSFPNPFNSTTQLRFGLDHDADVSLTVYDITGRKVVDLLQNTRLSAGEHTLNWSPAGLASGIYIAHLQEGQRSRSQRLLYIR